MSGWERESSGNCANEWDFIMQTNLIFTNKNQFNWKKDDILWDFKIQTRQAIPARKLDLVIVKMKKTTTKNPSNYQKNNFLEKQTNSEIYNYDIRINNNSRFKKKMIILLILMRDEELFFLFVFLVSFFFFLYFSPYNESWMANKIATKSHKREQNIRVNVLKSVRMHIT